MHSHLHTKDNVGTTLLKSTSKATVPFLPFNWRIALILLRPMYRQPRSTAADKLAGCEEIMNALDECHARGFLWKAVGGCNGIKREVNRCLSQERSKKSGRNRETGLQRREQIETVWKQMDQGDFSALDEFKKD